MIHLFGKQKPGTEATQGSPATNAQGGNWNGTSKYHTIPGSPIQSGSVNGQGAYGDQNPAFMNVPFGKGASAEMNPMAGNTYTNGITASGVVPPANGAYPQVGGTGSQVAYAAGMGSGAYNQAAVNPALGQRLFSQSAMNGTGVNPGYAYQNVPQMPTNGMSVSNANPAYTFSASMNATGANSPYAFSAAAPAQMNGTGLNPASVYQAAAQTSVGSQGMAPSYGNTAAMNGSGMNSPYGNAFPAGTSSYTQTNQMNAPQYAQTGINPGPYASAMPGQKVPLQNTSGIQAYPRMTANGQVYQPAAGDRVYAAQMSTAGGYPGPNMRSPSNTGRIPVTGGGFVPGPVKIRRKPFVFSDKWLLLICAVLLVLFAVVMFVTQMAVLRYVFAALALAPIVLFWVKPLISDNRRTCFTVVFGALIVVAVTSAITGTGLKTTGRSGNTARVAQTVASSTAPVSSGNVTVLDSGSGQVLSGTVLATETATPAPTEDNEGLSVLESFFYHWQANNQDEMLNLCSPSWRSSVDNAQTALFGILANRTPKEYEFEKISGTSDDISRTVTMTALIDRNNGKDPVKYRLNVIVIRVDGKWYVDPQSLKTYEEADPTTDPATITAAPTAEPVVSPDTVLYYNPDGGSKYHLDQNCRSTHAKYLPMQGHFTYSQINDEQYASLSPCNVCAAPLR